MVLSRLIGLVLFGLLQARRWLWFLLRSFLSSGWRELFHPHRPLIGWCKGNQALSLIEHFQLTIQVLSDIHFRLSIASPLWAGWDLKAMTIEGKGIVVGHRASMLEAEKVFCSIFLRPGQVTALDLSRCYPKAGIELG